MADWPGWCAVMTRLQLAVSAPADDIDRIVPTTPADCAFYIGVVPSDFRWPEHGARVYAKARFAWADAMLAGEVQP